MFISSLSVSGYRSLKDVKITGMLPVCIFHGLNNTGKSNILSVLETIFRRKLRTEETTAVTEVLKQERRGNIWQGRITNFRDNFYKNGKEDIDFTVSITFADSELDFLREPLKQLKPYLAKPSYEKVLILDGKIRYFDDESADMLLDRAVFNNKDHVVFEVDESGKKSFFPKLTTLNAGQSLAYFEELMNLLADSFALLPADRYLTIEQELDESKGEFVLTPKTFKRWLFNLSLTRSGHKAFEDIRTMFASEPFSCGEVSFNRERGELEIMVEKENTRLPISRLGSGYQQILYIIANLVLNKGKMIGIEELEINLSPKAQKYVFEKLKEYVYRGPGLVTQVVVTSHSDYFEGRKDVRCYGVTHNGSHTNVESWSKAKRRKFFLRSKPSIRRDADQGA